MKYLLLLCVVISGTAFGQIDRKSIYTALSSESKQVLTNEIEKLGREKESDEKEAFLGALKMKLSGFQKTPKDKLSMFNEGKKLLEDQIKSNSDNAEFRFLRLLIQENAPKQLKYNGNIEADAAKILASYTSLPEATKNAIAKYAKKSSNLIGL
jgi:hypothetical protein